MTTDYTQYNKLRNGEATPDVAEVKALDHQNTTSGKQGINSLPLPPLKSIKVNLYLFSLTLGRSGQFIISFLKSPPSDFI